MIVERVRHAVDVFLGRGEAAITVPPLDGALRPNHRLDDAPLRIACAQPDCLAVSEGRIVVSSGRHLQRIEHNRIVPYASLDADIASLAAAPDGGIIAGLADGRMLVLGGQFDGRSLLLPEGARCLTAMALTGDALLVCNGSATHTPAEWRQDLMERNATGSVWRVDLSGGRAERIVAGLAYPSGVIAAGEDFVVSESWKHRLLRYRATGNGRDEILGDLPGYPGRLSSASDGGYWLSVFAPRSQLVEFVLHEPGFRKRMMAEVEPDYWISPTLRAGRSHYDVLQGGGVKHLGILKPWSPTRSFGMLAHLDGDFQPDDSYQSRADGRTHGVTSALEHGGKVYAASKGDNVIVAFDPPAAGEIGGVA
jgi:hypothetical protein